MNDSTIEANENWLTARRAIICVSRLTDWLWGYSLSLFSLRL